jgi:hypothetical protein
MAPRLNQDQGRLTSAPAVDPPTAFDSLPAIGSAASFNFNGQIFYSSFQEGTPFCFSTVRSTVGIFHM